MINLPEPKDDCGKFCMDLFRRKQKGEITTEELEKETAYASLQYGFYELAYNDVRVERPRILNEYYSIPEDEREVDDSFWQKAEIKEYFKKKSAIESQNISNYNWLNTILKIFVKEGDEDSQQKVRNLLNAYPQEFKVHRRKDGQQGAGEDGTDNTVHRVQGQGKSYRSFRKRPSRKSYRIRS